VGEPHSLLRLSRERRMKQADSENDPEPDPPHEGTSVGMAGGSLADDGCTQELAALVEHGERQAYLDWQTPDEGATSGYLTPHEAGDVVGQVVDEDTSAHARVDAAQFVNERKGQRTFDTRMTPPVRVALTAAAATVIEDNGNTMDDATQDKLEEVCDAVESAWFDPEPPETWTVHTTPECDCSLDIPKIPRARPQALRRGASHSRQEAAGDAGRVLPHLLQRRRARLC
jgi:hypothetical protein